LGLNLDERTLSALESRGSGSASRSIPTGFVEWYAGTDDSSSIAESIAAPDHWNLVDIIAIVSTEHKTVGSTGGHSLAKSSPLQASRVDDTPRRLDICRQALLNRDFDSLAEVVEQDSLMMHAVMITSRPALFYWLPATLLLFEAVTSWRRSGLPVCFTTDAGPNVHIITTDDFADEIRRRISEFEDVKEMRRATPGKGTHLLPTYLNPPDD
jgi:diphosphomevalonate decarboxylase